MKNTNSSSVEIIGQTSVMTIQELAGYLKIPISTIYKTVREGSIPSQKVGRHWRFHRDAIDEWLKQAPANVSKQ